MKARAKVFTGRQKILSRYRSYHGGTNATLQLTGDPRRWANEPGMPGVVRVMDPWPYKYAFGDDPAAITRNNLTYLEEVIDYEGPHTIAAMIVKQAIALGVIGFAGGKIAATLWGPFFPQYVLLEPGDAVRGFAVVMVVSVLGSMLAVRAALKIDPATAIGG